MDGRRTDGKLFSKILMVIALTKVTLDRPGLGASASCASSSCSETPAPVSGSGDQSIIGLLTKLFGFGLSIMEKMAMVKIVTDGWTEGGHTENYFLRY